MRRRARRFARSGPTRALLLTAISVAVLVAISPLATGAVPGRSPNPAVGPRAATGASASPGLVVPAASPAITFHFPHPTWVNVTSDRPDAAPPPATGVAAAYDPIDNETVEFGGCLGVGPCPDNQTWVLRDGLWSNETQHADAPRSREYAAMDYDANLHAVLLFGGYGGTTAGYLNDTWMFSNGTWTNVSWYSAAAPPAGEGAEMAFDPEPEENGSVLFGGCVPSTFLGIDCSNETWDWEGDAGWVELSPSVEPPARGYGQIGYDPIDGVVVLFGGEYGFLGLLGDTWELYSGQWWNVTGSTGPGPYAAGGLVYDPSEQEMVLFGGINASFDITNETWTLVNGSWSSQSPSASPPARFDFATAVDSTDSVPIIQGGENATIDYNDTWAYEFPPVAALGANNSAPEASESVEFTTSITDGTPPFRADISFGDGDDATASGSGTELFVNHTFASPGTFVPSVTVVDAVGAVSTAAGPTITVGTAPSVSARATPDAGDAGTAIDFSSHVVADAAPPFSYAWNFGDHTTGTGADPDHAYTAAGTYTVTLNATNADHVTASSRIVVTVANPPTVVVTATPTASTPGGVVTFYANVTGGQPPYSYAWKFEDGGTSALPYPQHRYTGTGTYAVQVWVNDSVGGSTHGSFKVSVASSTSHLFPALADAPSWLWGALAGVAAVGVAGSVLLWRRGRRPRTP